MAGKPALVRYQNGLPKVVATTNIKTNCKSFDREHINLNRVNLQAVNHIANRFGLPLPTARLIAELAGLAVVYE